MNRAFGGTLRIVMATVLAVSFSSCMIMRTSEKGYQPVRLVKNGTAYEAELLAEGADGGLAVSAMIIGAGAANLHGPYRLQFTAYGREGEHRLFDINEVRIRSDRGQTARLGRDQVMGSPVFRPGEWRGEVKAVRPMRGLISCDPKKEGRIAVDADVRIHARDRIRRDTLHVVFEPRQAVKLESINVLWEIKKSFWKESREHPVTAWQTEGGNTEIEKPRPR